MVIIKVIAETPPEKNNIFYTRNVVQKDLLIKHCVKIKTVRIRSFSGPNGGKYGPKKL